MKKRVVVVCPGRGSYTKETLGYLNPSRERLSGFLADLDKRRTDFGEPTISELDQADRFKVSLHTKGEHASALIYACSYADFTAIDQEQFEIVAVTGNSMGWYLALAMAGSLEWAEAFQVIQTMGSQMKSKLIGGQLIYSVVDENWKKDPQREAHLEQTLSEINDLEDCECYDSIFLGGYRVIGGNKKALGLLMERLEPNDPYPFQLVNHGAFHTPMLRETSLQAQRELAVELFQPPKIPLIDGRGMIWKPYSTDTEKLHSYTLGHQVSEVYDFSAAIEMALKEFAPDQVILLGPGNSLGGAVGQVMIEHGWNGIASKSDFISVQKSQPVMISMGLAEQKDQVTGNG